MAVQNDNTILNKGDLKAYHERILPYLGGNMMVSTNNSDYYSTDEKIVGVWTDGRPLYQTTYNFTMPAANVEYTIATLPTGANPKQMYGGIEWGTGSYIEVNYYDSSAPTSCLCYVNNRAVKIMGRDQDLANKPAFVTVKYTKTTDAAGSAITTPGAYDINFPNTWPENQEIYFGNGLYGIRATGSHATTTSRYDVQLLQYTNGVEIVSYGGHIYPDNTTWNIQIPYTWTEGGSNYLAYVYGNNDPTHPSWNGIMLYLKSNINLTAKWDVWVTYTK